MVMNNKRDREKNISCGWRADENHMFHVAHVYTIILYNSYQAKEMRKRDESMYISITLAKNCNVECKK